MVLSGFGSSCLSWTKELAAHFWNTLLRKSAVENLWSWSTSLRTTQHATNIVAGCYTLDVTLRNGASVASCWSLWDQPGRRVGYNCIAPIGSNRCDFRPNIIDDPCDIWGGQRMTRGTATRSPAWRWSQCRWGWGRRPDAKLWALCSWITPKYNE